jgi:hypothetical protein
MANSTTFTGVDLLSVAVLRLPMVNNILLQSDSLEIKVGLSMLMESSISQEEAIPRT